MINFCLGAIEDKEQSIRKALFLLIISFSFLKPPHLLSTQVIRTEEGKRMMTCQIPLAERSYPSIPTPTTISQQIQVNCRVQGIWRWIKLFYPLDLPWLWKLSDDQNPGSLDPVKETNTHFTQHLYPSLLPSVPC